MRPIEIRVLQVTFTSCWKNKRGVTFSRELWLIHTGRDRDREWDQNNRRQWVRFLSLSQCSVNSKHNILKPIDPGPVPSPTPSPGSVQCEYAIRRGVVNPPKGELYTMNKVCVLIG